LKTQGHIEKLPSGRFRARRGKETLGTFDTEPRARQALGGGNLGAVWPDFIVRRRASGVRDLRNDESRWELYVANDPIARVALSELSRRDAKAWLFRMQARGLAAQTVKNAMNLIRIVCADALTMRSVLARLEGR